MMFKYQPFLDYTIFIKYFEAFLSNANISKNSDCHSSCLPLLCGHHHGPH